MLNIRESYPNDTSAMQNAIEVFNKYPNIDTEFGTIRVNSSRMAKECEMILESNFALKESNVPSEESGLRLVRIAQAYEQIGDENLVLNYAFSQETVSGKAYSLLLFAAGYETLSEAVKWEDPKKAAEYQQKALFYNKERGDEEAARINESFIRGTTKVVHCWFCGKEVTGNNIHFVPMDSNITTPILSQIDSAAIMPTNDEKHIYACRACYSSIDFNGYKHYKKACEHADAEVAKLRTHVDQGFSLIADNISRIKSDIKDLYSLHNNLVRQLNRR